MENLIESDPLHFLKKVQVQKKKKKMIKKKELFLNACGFTFVYLTNLMNF